MVSQPRRYEVLEVLGAGGFGTVYRVRYLGTGGFVKEVALKALNPDVEGVAEIAGRLRDEARVLGLLHHRAIVQVEGLVQIDGRWAVIMEYVEGADLGQILARGPVPQGPAMEIAAEVAGALDAAFTQPGPDGLPLRLLHRDIKPSNIRLTCRGETKLLDFGIARAEFSAREAHTRSLGFGTPDYMSPERLDTSEDTVKGDVYALGAVLFELLTGSKLGRGSANPDRHRALLERARERLLVVPDLLPDLVPCVLGALTYMPEERPDMGVFELTALRLARQVGGEPLRMWAAEAVPATLAELKAHGPQPSSVPPGAILVEGGPSPDAASTASLGASLASSSETRFEALVLPRGQAARASAGRLEQSATGATTAGLPARDEAPGPSQSGAPRAGFRWIGGVVALGLLALVGIGVGWLLRGPETSPPAIEIAAPMAAAEPPEEPESPASSASSTASSTEAPPPEVVAPSLAAPAPSAPAPSAARTRAQPRPRATAEAPPPEAVPGPPDVRVLGDLPVFLLVDGVERALPGPGVAGDVVVFTRVEGALRQVGRFTLAPGERVTLRCEQQFAKCMRVSGED